MVEIRVGTTDDVSGHIAAIRALLTAAFGGEFSDDDWAHSIGGVHVVASDGSEVVAHASLIERDLVVAQALIPVGYVEAVATAPERQGSGLGTMTMRTVGDLLVGDGRAGFLSTGAWRFYERLGWQRWTGPTFVVTDDGRRVRTADEDDGIMVLDPSGRLDRRADLACFERTGGDW